MVEVDAAGLDVELDDAVRRQGRQQRRGGFHAARGFRELAQLKMPVGEHREHRDAQLRLGELLLQPAEPGHDQVGLTPRAEPCVVHRFDRLRRSERVTGA